MKINIKLNKKFKTLKNSDPTPAYIYFFKQYSRYTRSTPAFFGECHICFISQTSLAIAGTLVLV